MSKRTRSKLRKQNALQDAIDDGIESDKSNVPVRAPISYIGVLIGITLIAGGAWMFLDPSDMVVEHHRLRYLPSVAEHVTPVTSQFYGVVSVVLGLLVLAFAIYSPRR
jgi:hypothetical protein